MSTYRGLPGLRIGVAYGYTYHQIIAWLEQMALGEMTRKGLDSTGCVCGL